MVLVVIVVQVFFGGVEAVHVLHDKFAAARMTPDLARFSLRILVWN